MIRLVDFFQSKTVDSILDIGTGSGDFIEVLKEVFPYAKITGVDPDQESLNSAKEKYTDVIFNKMIGEDLNFANHNFDVVCISMALHHLPDVQKALQEMQRVVKPGGWIIVNELFSDNLNPAQEVHKMFHHFRSKIDRLIGINHNETFEKEEIRKMIKTAGIQILFDFENKIDPIQYSEEGELETRLEKMQMHLEKINSQPEYDIFKPQIEQFRFEALKHGFQSATRIVVVGTPTI
jgi:ubiquinone/menaquinone biosynthesis C-methylase UbiE